MCIDVATVKTYLKLQDINLELTDDDLESLIYFEINHIASETGRELNLTPHIDTELHFNSSRMEYNLKHYPVVEILEVSVDNQIIPSENYVVNKDAGIIKFIKQLPMDCNVLKVDYTSKETDNWIITNVQPVLLDIIKYRLNNTPLKNVTSVKEGDVSVNYDTANSEYTLITQRLKQLRMKTVTRMV